MAGRCAAPSNPNPLPRLILDGDGAARRSEPRHRFGPGLSAFPRRAPLGGDLSFSMSYLFFGRGWDRLMKAILTSRKFWSVARDRRQHGVEGRRRFFTDAGAAVCRTGAPSSPTFPEGGDDGGRPCPASSLGRPGPGVPERRYLLSASPWARRINPKRRLGQSLGASLRARLERDDIPDAVGCLPPSSKDQLSVSDVSNHWDE